MLEIEEGGVGLAAGELESAEEDADADADAVGEEEALAEVSDGVGHARRFGAVVAWRAVLLLLLVLVRPTRGPGLPLPALELLDGLAQPVLRLPEPPLSVHVVLERRRR